MTARIALLTYFMTSLLAMASAETCVSPRVKRVKACGVVIDPYGMFVPNAKVTFGAGQTTGSVVTDAHGKFSSPASGDEMHLSIDAPGFQSVETTIGRLKQANGVCRKPLYVMLTISQQGCAMISSRRSDLLLAKKE